MVYMVLIKLFIKCTGNDIVADHRLRTIASNEIATNVNFGFDHCRPVGDEVPMRQILNFIQYVQSANGAVSFAYTRVHLK